MVFIIKNLEAPKKKKKKGKADVVVGRMWAEPVTTRDGGVPSPKLVDTD